MIAIKGMDMPISTQKCQFFKRDSHFENGTQIVSDSYAEPIFVEDKETGKFINFLYRD
jgi:hypothetical protein